MAASLCNENWHLSSLFLFDIVVAYGSVKIDQNTCGCVKLDYQVFLLSVDLLEVEIYDCVASL